MEFQNTWFCGKHGNYIGTPGYRPNVDPFPECPSCKEVREKNLCVECGKHPASVMFSNGVMDHLHGMDEKLCRCCYFKKVETAYFGTKENYEKLKSELEKEACLAP